MSAPMGIERFVEPVGENQYRCAICGEVYDKAISDEEAMKEAEGYWPGVTQEECEIVCDDCWIANLRPENHPEEYKESLQHAAETGSYK